MAHKPDKEQPKPTAESVAAKPAPKPQAKPAPKPVAKPAPKPALKPKPAPVAMFTFDRWFASTGKPSHWKGGMRKFVKNLKGKRTAEQWDALFQDY